MPIQGFPEEEYFVSGHRACAGCGATTAVRLITKAVGKNCIVVEPTGCVEVVSTPYPQTAWRVPWIHGAFENAASIASGIRKALEYLGKDVKVLVIAGDGATFDIGFGHLSGSFERGDKILYCCCDNEAYMNTGVQRSGATPYAAWTTTTPPGKVSIGKCVWRKDLVEIMAAHNAAYSASASIGYPHDLYKKLQKGVKLVEEGPVFFDILVPCPTGWGFPSNLTIEFARFAVETGMFPLYEIEKGEYKLQRPQSLEELKPVREYLEKQRRFTHLFKPKPNEDVLGFIESETRRRLERLIRLSERR